MPFPSGSHLLVILGLLVVVLIIWGPGKLPDLGAGMGRAIREFKKASSEAKEQLTNSVAADSGTIPSTGGEGGDGEGTKPVSESRSERPASS